MRLEVKAVHGHVSESVRAYVEKRLSKLARRLYDGTRVEVILSREHNPSIRDDHTAEAIVFAKGSSLIARESAPTWEAAVDELVEKLERQVERYQDKRRQEPRRLAQRKGAGPLAPGPAPGEGVGAGAGEAGGAGEASGEAGAR